MNNFYIYLDDGGEDEDIAVVAFKNERIKDKEASERSFSKLVHLLQLYFFFGISTANQILNLTCSFRFIPDWELSSRQRNEYFSV